MQGDSRRDPTVPGQPGDTTTSAPEIDPRLKYLLDKISGWRLLAWLDGRIDGYREGYADAISATHPEMTVQEVIDELETRGIRVPEATRALGLS